MCVRTLTESTGVGIENVNTNLYLIVLNDIKLYFNSFCVNFFEIQ